MKLLTLILTSSKINLLKRCLKSAQTQNNTTIDNTIKIVVNTLNEDYYKEVVKTIKGVEIIRTKSNGSPGMGHNSCLKVFQDRPEYGWALTYRVDPSRRRPCLHRNGSKREVPPIRVLSSGQGGGPLYRQRRHCERLTCRMAGHRQRGPCYADRPVQQVRLCASHCRPWAQRNLSVQVR